MHIITIKKLLARINIVLLLCLVIGGVLGCAVLILFRGSLDAQGDVTEERFANDLIPVKEGVVGTAISLNKVALALPVPQLNQEIIFYGVDERPGVDHVSLLLGINNSEEYVAVDEGQRVFLSYNDGKYYFSKGNKETALWITPELQAESVSLVVGMLDDEGKEVDFSFRPVTFVLSPKNYFRTTNKTWELGPWRVDATLLARQQARWFGKDIFMDTHGGDEYSCSKGRERIEFDSQGKVYCCYAGEGDVFVWDNNRWIVKKAESSVKHKPLLRVNKVDDRLMSLELWDADGRAKMSLNVIKLNEYSFATHCVNDIKFLGAKTWKQCILEISGKRIIVHPHDWLLHDSSGWHKLSKAEEITDYVERRVSGELLVIDEIIRQKGSQMLKGHLFNPLRTKVAAVTLMAGGEQPIVNDEMISEEIVEMQREYN